MGVGGISLHNVLSQRFFLKIFLLAASRLVLSFVEKSFKKNLWDKKVGVEGGGRRGTCITAFFAATFTRESGPQAQTH